MDKEINDNNEEYFKLKKEIVITILEIILAIFVGIGISKFAITNTEVPTGSMVPTIEEHALLFSNRLAYKINKPERFDIVVFKHPDEDDKLLIKRVIGLPGETVSCKSGQIYVDGIALNEHSYLADTVHTSDFGPYEIPEDCYFMLGDNREGSYDARYWQNKFVSADNIIAKAWFEYKPEFRKLN